MYRRLSSNVICYGIATIVQSFAAFAMVPILLRLIGVEEFSRWSVIEPILVYGAPLILVGANYGLYTAIGNERLSVAEATQRIGIPVLSIALLGAVAALGIIFAWLSNAVIATLVACIIFVEAALIFLQTGLRAAARAGHFSFAVLAKAGTILAIGAMLVVKGLRIEGIEWILLLYLAGGASGLLISLRASGFAIRTKPDSRSHKAAILYGLPIMIAAFLSGVVMVADRYVLAGFISPVDLAGYVATAKLVGVINLAAAPFALWFPAARFEHLKDPDGGTKFFSTVLLFMLGLFVAMAGCFLLMGPVVYGAYTNGMVWNPTLAVALAIGAVATALCTPVGVGLLSEGKTIRLPFIVLAVVAVELMLLFMLCPTMGANGAGLAVCIAQVLNLVLTYAASQRIHRVDWPLKECLLVAAGGGLLLALAIRLQ